MKFDYIIGNPPYNKGIVQHKHPVHRHPAINSEREGYIGFFIQSLQLLQPGGVLEFITPGKFMVGPGSRSFREWLIKNYDLTEIYAVPDDTFEGIGIDKIVVTTVINRPYGGHTTVKNLNGTIVTMDVRENRAYTIPDFGSEELFSIYRKLQNFDTIPHLNSGCVGEYGEAGKGLYHSEQSPLFNNKVATGVDAAGNVAYAYTSQSSTHSNAWRMVAKNSFQRGFGIIEPGIEVDHTLWSVNCGSESMARTMRLWTTTKLFKLLWSSFHVTRHTHVIIRNIPCPPGPAESEEDIYHSFNLTPEEIATIERLQL